MSNGCSQCQLTSRPQTLFLFAVCPRGSGPDAAEHRRNADRAEFALLREIAEQVPELTAAVWRLSGSLDVDTEA